MGEAKDLNINNLLVFLKNRQSVNSIIETTRYRAILKRRKYFFCSNFEQLIQRFLADDFCNCNEIFCAVDIVKAPWRVVFAIQCHGSQGGKQLFRTNQARIDGFFDAFQQGEFPKLE